MLKSILVGLLFLGTFIPSARCDIDDLIISNDGEVLQFWFHPDLELVILEAIDLSNGKRPAIKHYFSTDPNSNEFYRLSSRESYPVEMTYLNGTQSQAFLSLESFELLSDQEILVQRNLFQSSNYFSFAQDDRITLKDPESDQRHLFLPYLARIEEVDASYSDFNPYHPKLFETEAYQGNVKNGSIELAFLATNNEDIFFVILSSTEEKLLHFKKKASDKKFKLETNYDLLVSSTDIYGNPLYTAEGFGSFYIEDAKDELGISEETLVFEDFSPKLSSDLKETLLSIHAAIKTNGTRLNHLWLGDEFLSISELFEGKKHRSCTHLLEKLREI